MFTSAVIACFASIPQSAPQYSMCLIPDINKDRIDDVAIGMNGLSLQDVDEVVSGKGSVRFISGADGSIISSIEGRRKGELFGTSVILGPDGDKDGIADVWVGVPASLEGTSTPTHAKGSVRLVSTSTEQTLREFTWPPPYVEGGAFLINLGPGDGAAESNICVCSLRGNIMFAISGHDGKVLWSRSSEEEYYGLNVCSVGDKTGDGTNDLILANEYTAPIGNAYYGSIVLIDGRTGVPTFAAKGSDILSSPYAVKGDIVCVETGPSGAVVFSVVHRKSGEVRLVRMTLSDMKVIGPMPRPDVEYPSLAGISIPSGFSLHSIMLGPHKPREVVVGIPSRISDPHKCNAGLLCVSPDLQTEKSFYCSNSAIGELVSFGNRVVAIGPSDSAHPDLLVVNWTFSGFPTLSEHTCQRLSGEDGRPKWTASLTKPDK